MEVIDIPRLDGTGPLGLGPITGRGAGLCFRRGYMSIFGIASLALMLLGILFYLFKIDASNKKEV